MDYKVAREKYNDVSDKLARFLNSVDFMVSCAGSRSAYQSRIFHEMLKKSKNKKCSKGLFVNLAILFMHRVLWKRFSKEIVVDNQPIILIDLFVIPSMVNNYGELEDRYYTGIENFVEEVDFKRCYFVPTFTGSKLKSLWSKARSIKSNYQFLFKESFLKTSDYFFALTHFCRVWKLISKIRKVEWLEEHFKDLFVKELRANTFHFATLNALLNYRFAKRLKEKGIKVDLLIDWNENQILDKGLNKGFHDFMPSTYRKGYQGFYNDPLYNFHLAPTVYEVENGYYPHELVVVGDGIIEQNKEFCSQLKVLSGPAFRFQHLFLSEKPKLLFNKKVLVGLPVNLNEAENIISLVDQICDQFNELEFVVKAHPATPIHRILKGNNISYSDMNSGILMNGVDLLISASSSLCLEAITRGIPVILIKNQATIFQNAIPTSVDNRMWKVVESEQYLAEAINQLISMKRDYGSEIVRVAYETRQKFFNQPTKKLVADFLKRNAHENT